MRTALLLALFFMPSHLLAASAQGQRTFKVDKSYEEVVKILTEKESFSKFAGNNFKIIDFKVSEFEVEGEKELFKLGDGEGFEKLRVDAQVYIHAKANIEGCWRDIHLSAQIHKGEGYACAKARLLQSAGRITGLTGSLEIFKQSDGKAMLRVRLWVRAATPYARCCLVRRIINRKATGIICGHINSSLCKVERSLRYIIATTEVEDTRIRILDILEANQK